MGVAEFLAQAKRSTYAGGGDDAGVGLSDGARELTYSEQSLTYRDRYYGWSPFSGEEVVQDRGRTVWTMNYYGLCLSDELTPSQIYDFLVKALGRVSPEKPFRGPETYREGAWSYICRPCGDAHEFHGSEKILYREKEVYRLLFHGGDVGWKPV
jgi:hypothetical protein